MKMVNYLINHLLKKMNKINIETIRQFKDVFKFNKDFGWAFLSNKIHGLIT